VQNFMTPTKKTQKYARVEHAIVAVDVVVLSVIEGRLNVLLTQTNKPELKGLWAVPGGLVAPDESLDAAVLRVLATKTGLTNVLTEQLATFGDPGRDPFGRVISVAYIALVHADAQTLATTREYDAIAWRPVDHLPRMAYDHKEIVRTAVQRLRARLTYTTIARGILAEEFTLTEMQELYEHILGHTLDKRNFRKKILSAGIIEKTGRQRRGQRSRPAALYRFRTNTTQIIDLL